MRIMEIFNEVEIFVKAKIKAYGLTVGRYYKIYSSIQHFDDKCFGIKDDNGLIHDYNIGYFELK